MKIDIKNLVLFETIQHNIRSAFHGNGVDFCAFGALTSRAHFRYVNIGKDTKVLNVCRCRGK